MRTVLGTCGAAALAVLVGCASGPAKSESDFQVTETKTELRIDQRDAAGLGVASLILRIGTVVIPDDGRTGPGRQLDIQVGPQQAQHVSLDFGPRQLPVPDGLTGPIGAFVSDPHVAPVLAKWGITFEELNARPTAAAQTETGYASCQYNVNTSTCGASNSPCCEFYDSTHNTPYEVVCCSISSTLSIRACTTQGDATNPCGTPGVQGCTACINTNYPTAPSGGSMTCSVGASGSACAGTFTVNYGNSTESCVSTGGWCSPNSHQGDAECCSGNCSTSTHKCVACIADGNSCAGDSECCTGTCTSGTCGVPTGNCYCVEYVEGCFIALEPTYYGVMTEDECVTNEYACDGEMMVTDCYID